MISAASFLPCVHAHNIDARPVVRGAVYMLDLCDPTDAHDPGMDRMTVPSADVIRMDWADLTRFLARIKANR